MSSDTLLCIYVFALIVQIILLCKLKADKILPWIGLYLFEIGSTVAALAVLVYYNMNPGYMLSTMGHVLYSMCAAAVFGFMLLVTIIVHLFKAFVCKTN